MQFCSMLPRRSHAAFWRMGSTLICGVGASAGRWSRGNDHACAREVLLPGDR